MTSGLGHGEGDHMADEPTYQGEHVADALEQACDDPDGRKRREDREHDADQDRGQDAERIG